MFHKSWNIEVWMKQCHILLDRYRDAPEEGREQSKRLTFWIKLMFVGAAYFQSKNVDQFRAADRNTLAFVDHGYVDSEIRIIESLFGVSNTKRLAKPDDVVALFNNRTPTIDGKKQRVLLQDVSFFCHGCPGILALNDSLNDQPGQDRIEIQINHFEKCKTDAFADDGRIYSYACRTGIGVEDMHKESFNNELEAEPWNSLAQGIADHFQIDVFAFFRKTDYHHTLYTPTEDEHVKNNMPDEPLPIDYSLGRGMEALYHEHVDWPDSPSFRYPKYSNHALWRRGGSYRLPQPDIKPTGVGHDHRRFTPEGRS